MTVTAAESSPTMQGPRQAGTPASWEQSGVQADSVKAESPSASARDDVEMLTEDLKASLCLLDLRESCPTTRSDPVHGDEGHAAEQIEDPAGHDHVMPDVKEIRNGAGEQPRFSSLSIIAPLKTWGTEKKHQLDSYLKDVRGLLSTGLLEGFKVIYRKDKVEMIGRISGQGYSCGCSECNYNSNVMNACEFEQHSGQSSKNQNDHIFLDSGISLFRAVKVLKQYKLDILGEVIEEKIRLPPNLDEYSKWKASLQKVKDDLGAPASDGCSTQSQDCLKESATNSILDLHWSTSKRRSGRQFKRRDTETPSITLSKGPDTGVCGTYSNSKESKTETSSITLSAGPDKGVSGIDSKSKEPKMRDNSLHPLIFKEGGLPDNTLLTYKLKNGEALKQGYKQGSCIICNCCKQEFTPSHFEEHAGMGRRRQPYQNIYTSDGITLHELSLQLQDRLYSNGFGNANVSSFSGYPNLTSSGCDKEPSTTSGPIVPLKRTLQERVVATESCYLCGYGNTTIGSIDPDMIVFCNQCERPCHVKCYNKGLEKKKAPLKVLKEYVQFNFLCCKECELLRLCLEDGLEKCEQIIPLRKMRSHICSRLLSGMSASSDVKLYLPQVIDIFKDAFVETTDEHSDDFSDMVFAKDAEGEKNFRGMYCALITASKHVVSAAILKVRMEQVAELVLVATRREFRKKGYFLLLLKSIEKYLRNWKVSLLTAPVDPEMAQIWSEKLGFTILSAEEKSSMLESHPLVMFENMVLVQKSLT